MPEHPPDDEAAGPSAPRIAGLAASPLEPALKGLVLIEELNCAACHGEQGAGVAGAYPPLAGNRAVTMAVPANLVRIVLEGGFAPSSAGHPRPYGMPPFAHVLDNDDIALLLTHVRSSWGNRAPAVTSVDVNRYRGRGVR